MPNRDAYMAVGFHGQVITVLPKLDIVAVATGAARFPAQGGPPSVPRFSLDSLIGFLTAAVKPDAPLTADAAAMADLADRLKAAGIERGWNGERAIGVGESRFWQDLSVCRQSAHRPLGHLQARRPQPSFEYELHSPQRGGPQGRFGGPIGFVL
jgi:hypothetical protein